jgi:hypothetical protein
MKTSLKLIALIIAAGYSVAAFADFAGINVPALNPESAVSLFVASLLGLMFISDYTRRTRSLSVKRAPLIVAPANAFVAKCTGKAECLAA